MNTVGNLKQTKIMKKKFIKKEKKFILLLYSNGLFFF